jgi:hypothetical protein
MERLRITTPGNQVKYRDYQGYVRDLVMGLGIGPKSGHCHMTSCTGMKRNDKATSEKTIIIIAIVKKMTAPQQ